MSKREVTSDSEDEAFQSADEGEIMEDGPNPQGQLETSENPSGQQQKVSDVESGKDNEINMEDEANDTQGDSPILEHDKDETSKTKEDEEGGNDASADLQETVNSDSSVDLSDAKKAAKAGEEASETTLPESVEIKDQQSAEEEENILKSDDGNDSSVNDAASVEIAKDDNADALTEVHLDAKVHLDAEIEQQSGSPEVVNSPIAQAMDRLTMTAEESKTDETNQESLSSEAEASGAGWGWGGWGNMISKATSSVSSMLETVESQLGIPNPVEMAKIVTHADSEEKQNQEQEESKIEQETGEASPGPIETQASDGAGSAEAQGPEADGQPGGSGLSSWLSGFGVSKISTMVQKKGKNFVSGSLDALEFVGKKTIDVISKGDPGFRRKRTTLSQAIREAKEKSESKEADGKIDEEIITFSIEFDRFQGLAHLEALEMISHECEGDLEKALLDCSEEAKLDNENLFEVVKKKFEEAMGEEEEESEENSENFEVIINEQIANFSLSITASKLLAFYSSSKNVNLDDVPAQEVFTQAVTSFAEMTARSVEFFHKVGELMLLPDVKASFLVKSRAERLRKICQTLKGYVTALSTQYAARLNGFTEEQADGKDISKFITDVYLEASSSATYIEDSYHLLLPIFQFTAVR